MARSIGTHHPCINHAGVPLLYSYSKGIIHALPMLARSLAPARESSAARMTMRTRRSAAYKRGADIWSGSLYTGWLDIPAKQVVIEACVESNQEEEFHRHQDEAVKAIMAALREHRWADAAREQRRGRRPREPAKVLQRRTFGRANSDLLHKRVLLAE